MKRQKLDNVIWCLEVLRDDPAALGKYRAATCNMLIEKLNELICYRPGETIEITNADWR